MRVKIQLFGILGLKLPEFNSPQGVELDLPDGSTAGYLLEYLKIPKAWGAAVAMNSRLLKQEDSLEDDADIRIVQAVHGG